MSLQKSPSTPAGQTSATSVRPRGTATQSSSFASGRTYPPMTWTTPSMSKTVAKGLGGIGRAMLVTVLMVSALVGAGMVIALILTTIVQAFGFDASGGY